MARSWSERLATYFLVFTSGIAVPSFGMQILDSYSGADERKELTEAHKELKQTREDLKAARDDLRGTREELVATRKELSDGREVDRKWRLTQDDHYNQLMKSLANTQSESPDPPARDVAIDGIGSESCRQVSTKFKEDPSAVAYDLMGWSYGYMTRRNVERASKGKPSVVLQNAQLTSKKMVGILLSFCESHQDTPVVLVVNALFEVLSENPLVADAQGWRMTATATVTGQLRLPTAGRSDLSDSPRRGN